MTHEITKSMERYQRSTVHLLEQDFLPLDDGWPTSTEKIDGLYAFFQYWKVCASELQSLRLITRGIALNKCQSCLLNYLSVTHMEELKPIYGKHGEFVEYWVVGESFLKENLIVCYDPRKCDVIFSNVERGFPSHDVRLHGSTLAPFIVPIEYLGNSELQAHAPENFVVTDRAELSSISKKVDQPSLAPHVQKSSLQCIFKYAQSVTSICETCIKKASTTGSMKKYWLYYRQVSVIYIIEVSDPKISEKNCDRENICKEGLTAVLSKNLCKLFIKIVSPKLDNQYNDGSGKIDDTVSREISMTNYNKFFTIWKSAPKVNVKRKFGLLTQLEKIHSQVHCLRTDCAMNRSHTCWSCLAKISHGMVSLHRSQVTESTNDKQSYLIRLFTNEPASKFMYQNPVNCASACGEIDSGEDDCTLAAVHVDNFLPPNDISLSIQGELFAKMKTDAKNRLSGCILTRHISTKSACRSCFPKSGKVWKLSTITFLVSLSLDWKEIIALHGCIDNMENGCVQLERMPDIMCNYELKRNKPEANHERAFDLNLPPSEEDQSQTGPTSGASESTSTGSLRALKWDVNSGNDTIACLDCLAARRKIVLISLENKYVWMVTYQKPLPDCGFCSKIKTPVVERNLQYSHYLRQISSVEVYEHIYGERKEALDHDTINNFGKRKQEDDHRQANRATTIRLSGKLQ